jgi:hypothetical protein
MPNRHRLLIVGGLKLFSLVPALGVVCYVYILGSRFSLNFGPNRGQPEKVRLCSMLAVLSPPVSGCS